MHDLITAITTVSNESIFFQLMSLLNGFAAVIVVWLHWVGREIRIIGRLAANESDRPTPHDWNRLMKAVARSGSEEQFRAQMANLHARFGLGEIRCGHVVGLWGMVRSEIPWSVELPSFAEPASPVGRYRFLA